MTPHGGTGPRVKNAQKTTLNVNGKPHTFPSKAEAARYLQLKCLQKAGIVKEIELQPVFELQVPYRKCPKCGRVWGRITVKSPPCVMCPWCSTKSPLIKAITYRADFRVTYTDGHQEIEDVKGMETEIFKLKRKMFEYKYPELTLIVRKV
jgi:hypothetical protein